MCGAAMLVPDFVTKSAWLVASQSEAVDTIREPGAAISGLNLPPQVGPRLLLPAIKPRLDQFATAITL